MGERMLISYEWVIEVVTDDEHEDIMDLSHATALREYDPQELRDAVANKRYDEKEGRVYTRLALTRDKGNQIDGLVERQYAYADGEGDLPDEFEEGAKVPARYIIELAKFLGRAT